MINEWQFAVCGRRRFLSGCCRSCARDLAQGRFAPGERVLVDQLSSEFDVSPLPVREAMRVLLAEGRLTYSSHRGFRVTRLTLPDVEEIFLMCRLLEAEALRRGVPAMDDAGVERMRSLLERLQKVPGEAELWEQVESHQNFHFVPIDKAGLPRVSQELRRLWDHTDHYRALYLFQDEQAHRLLQEEHVAIFEACANRDAPLAAKLMKQHRLHAIRWLAQGLQRDEARSVGE